MAKILLGVTGSVAAMRTPALYEELKRAAHEIKIVATHASLYFFDPMQIDPVSGPRPQRNREVIILDEDEWPGRSAGRIYERNEPVLHIELRRWADLLLIAPLDANTLAKLANGLSDNCLTCVWRAWDRARPALLAPAMNTLMWEHPLTLRHLRQLAVDAGAGSEPEGTEPEALMEWINSQPLNLRLIPPISKRLACGDVGVGAMAEIQDIFGVVREVTRKDTSR